MSVSMKPGARTLTVTPRLATSFARAFDAPMTPGEDNRLLDYLADTEHATPEEETIELALVESVHAALGGLKEREAKILRLYFGLEGGREHTLEEIGSMLGVTRERVRQLRDRALHVGRHLVELGLLLVAGETLIRIAFFFCKS